jgi:hypothetical protein
VGLSISHGIFFFNWEWGGGGNVQEKVYIWLEAHGVYLKILALDGGIYTGLHVSFVTNLMVTTFGNRSP